MPERLLSLCLWLCKSVIGLVTQDDFYVTVFIAIVINKSRTSLSFNMTRDLKTSIKPNLGRDITTHKK